MIGFGAGDVFATPNVANLSCLRTGQVQETNGVVGSYTTMDTNPLMGSGSTYTVDLYNTNPDGSTFGVLLFAVFDSLSFGFKSEDFSQLGGGDDGVAVRQALRVPCPRTCGATATRH